MKKVIFIASVAVIAAMSSCSSKKDWTCSCSYTGGNTVDVKILNQTESDAKKVCETSSTCKLK